MERRGLRGEIGNHTFDFIFCLFIHDYRLEIKTRKVRLLKYFSPPPPAQTSAGGDKPATADGEVRREGRGLLHGFSLSRAPSAARAGRMQ